MYKLYNITNVLNLFSKVIKGNDVPALRTNFAKYGFQLILSKQEWDPRAMEVYFAIPEDMEIDGLGMDDELKILDALPFIEVAGISAIYSDGEPTSFGTDTSGHVRIWAGKGGFLGISIFLWWRYYLKFNIRVNSVFSDDTLEYIKGKLVENFDLDFLTKERQQVEETFYVYWNPFISNDRNMEILWSILEAHFDFHRKVKKGKK